MKKTDLLVALEETLVKKLTEFEFALDWDPKNHTIEIVVQLEAQKPETQVIEDTDGTIAEEDVVVFEDGILLYNPEKSAFDPEDYLKTIPYEGKKGLSLAFIEALGNYLVEILTEGQSDLLDFVTDDEVETFELHWSDEAFEQELAKQKTKNDQSVFIPYPKY